MISNMKHIKEILLILCCCLVLNACGVTEMLKNKSDPIAEEYLTKMLKAIEDQDADAAYDLLVKEYYKYEDMDNLMETLGKFWNGEEYTYELVYSSVNKNMGTKGVQTYHGRRYKVVTQDQEYSIDLTYLNEGEGLIRFYINLVVGSGDGAGTKL